MEVLIKNGDVYSLTNIPDNELSAVENNNDEVIIDFTISNEDREKIYKGCGINYIDGVVTAIMSDNYNENIVDEKLERLIEINDNVIRYGGSTTLSNDPKIEEIRTRKINAWKQEAIEIETDLRDNYNVSLVDDLIESIFG